jgi:polyphosphate kinase 2 (PPK2 family)
MERYRVEPGHKLRLKKCDAAADNAFDVSKKDGHEALARRIAERDAPQELLYAEHRHSLLVILQAMDAGGTCAARAPQTPMDSGPSHA